MISIDLGIVTGHGFGHSPDILTSRTQERVPKPHGGSQLRIVPSVATYIVLPRVAHGVVGMHQVAIVPETIPFLLLNGITVEVEILRQAFFHVGFAILWQTPNAEGQFLVQILRGWQEVGIII